MIIGLGHKRLVGKDTVAHYIITKYDYTRLAFADELKNLCQIVSMFYSDAITTTGFLENLMAWFEKYDLDGQMYLDFKEYAIGERKILSEREFESKKFRNLLQWAGTDFFRIRDPAFWVKIIQKQIIENQYCNFIIPDMRFPNEMQMVTDLGGVTVQILRDVDVKSEDAGKHLSETALDNAQYNYILENYGSIPELIENTKLLMEMILSHGL